MQPGGRPERRCPTHCITRTRRKERMTEVAQRGGSGLHVHTHTHTHVQYVHYWGCYGTAHVICISSCRSIHRALCELAGRCVQPTPGSAPHPETMTIANARSANTHTGHGVQTGRRQDEPPRQQQPGPT